MACIELNAIHLKEFHSYVAKYARYVYSYFNELDIANFQLSTTNDFSKILCSSNTTDHKSDMKIEEAGLKYCLTDKGMAMSFTCIPSISKQTFPATLLRMSRSSRIKLTITWNQKTA